MTIREALERAEWRFQNAADVREPALAELAKLEQVAAEARFYVLAMNDALSDHDDQESQFHCLKDALAELDAVQPGGGTEQ